MSSPKPSKAEKQSELLKYRDLVLATIDYILENKVMHVKTDDFDSDVFFEQIKAQTEEDFLKGRLAKLKQSFRDFTESQVETSNLKFNTYLKEKTNYDVDIFNSYFKRVEKIIEKGKITTDNQFYDINMMIDQLCHTTPVDEKKIERLNKLIRDYEKRKLN